MRKRVRKNTKMPGSARVGIALLILGAIVVGLGTLQNRQALSIYGFVFVVCGFFLYFISTLYIKKQKEKEKQQEQEKGKKEKKR
ncbi:MAG: hypothetical protein H0X03_04740 [Nitrosopumilus sp.]|nr:hypothetical protein [Nitrosopumilus sp.]